VNPDQKIAPMRVQHILAARIGVAWCVGPLPGPHVALIGGGVIDACRPLGQGVAGMTPPTGQAR
jgi:hypothetical protein